MITKYDDYLYEYVEFLKTGEKIRLKWFYDEFQQVVRPFLVKGEWYRIIGQYRNTWAKNLHKSTGNPFPKMLLLVIRFDYAYDDWGYGEICWYQEYTKGEIIDKDHYITYDTLRKYADVTIEHIITPERKKYLEERREKMKDIDPYGEEDWDN